VSSFAPRGIEDPKDRFGLAVGLWSEGLLETLST